MKSILFFSDKCPDTPAFVATLEKLDIDYQDINITDSIANLKQFLSLRDKSDAFDRVKANGNVGVPSLLTDDGKVYLSIESLEELK